MGGKVLPLYHQHKLELVNFVVGAAILTFELAASRIAAPYIGLTIYVWTSIIGVILASLALGYLLGGRLADRRHRPADVALLLLLAALSMGAINIIKDPFLAQLSGSSLGIQTQALLASCFLFTVPTVLLGAASPYLARLNISSVKTSGTQVSRIDAAGTFGSLFGTFFTGFFLFNLVGTRNILNLIILILLMTSFLVASRTYSRLRLSLIGVVLLLLLSPSHLAFLGVVEDFDTAYGRYIIRDVGSMRVLQSDNLAWQSGIDMEKPGSLVFPYTRSFLAVSSLGGDERRYLIIGGGAYTFPAALAQANPNSSVNVVEIDEQLLPVSERYFNFSQAPNIRIINGDGRQFLNGNTQRYGMIYLDAFSNTTPPFQLLTREAIDRQRLSLESGGVVAVNIISAAEGPDAALIDSAFRTYRQVFPHVKAYRIEPAQDPLSLQNILVLASQKPLDSVVRSLAEKNPEFKTIAQNPVPSPEAGMVLRDDFAPVEQMAAAQQ